MSKIWDTIICTLKGDLSLQNELDDTIDQTFQSAQKKAKAAHNVMHTRAQNVFNALDERQKYNRNMLRHNEHLITFKPNGETASREMAKLYYNSTYEKITKYYKTFDKNFKTYTLEQWLTRDAFSKIKPLMLLVTAAASATAMWQKHNSYNHQGQI